MSALRRKLDRQYVNHIWQSARADSAVTHLVCPMCSNHMRGVATLEQSGEPSQEALHVDVCVPCHTVWFDVGELESAKAVASLPEPERPDAALHPKAREAIAMAKIEMIRTQADSELPADTMPPDCAWRTLVTVLGIPVEDNPSSLSKWPWITWLTILLMALVSSFTLLVRPEWIQEWGFLPEDPFRKGGLTLLSAFFLHGGWMHLLGNALFLLVFGMKIEDRLGHAGMVLLLLFATLGGDILHLLFSPNSHIVCIGASGGISGVLALYALLYPKARLVFLFRAFFYIRWIRFPAWVALLIWLAMESFTVADQLSGRGNVSGLAHLGGILVGAAWWFALKIRESSVASRPSEFI